MAQLIAYGHSWVFGTGATLPERNLVTLVARELDLAADNRGVSSSLSTETAALVATGAPAANVYLVMTGFNDARLHGASRDSQEAYCAALDHLLDAFDRASPGALVVAVEQPKIKDYSGYPPYNHGSDPVIDAYNSSLRRVAAKHPSARTASVAGWDADAMLADDGVHPNDLGHACLAAAIVQVIAGERSVRSHAPANQHDNNVKGNNERD